MLAATPSFGFSITDPFKAVGRGIKTAAKAGYSAAQDTRVQRAAVAAAQAYAPQKYAQVTKFADRARGIIRPPGPHVPGAAMAAMPQMQPPGQPLPAMAPAGMMPPTIEEGAPIPQPVKQGNMLGIAAIVGAGVVIFLLMRK